MAKSKTLTHMMYTLEAKRRWSKYNQEYFYELDLISEHNGELYYTYVSESNENWAWWEPVVTAVLTRKDRVTRLDGEFRLKKGDSRLINADSQFTLAESYDKEQFLHAVWRVHYDV